MYSYTSWGVIYVVTARLVGPAILALHSLWTILAGLGV